MSELWPTYFSPEVFAGLLLDQNAENDVFEVWVGDEEELARLANVFERVYRCGVIRDTPKQITVCCPQAYPDE